MKYVYNRGAMVIILHRPHLGLDARKHGVRVCEQQRRRPACASAQTDQRHSCLLFGTNHI